MVGLRGAAKPLTIDSLSQTLRQLRPTIVVHSDAELERLKRSIGDRVHCNWEVNEACPQGQVFVMEPYKMPLGVHSSKP